MEGLQLFAAVYLYIYGEQLLIPQTTDEVASVPKLWHVR